MYITDLPTMEKDPVLTPIMTNDSFSLQCEFDPLTTVNVNYKYTLTWYLEDTVITTINMTNNTYMHEISKQELGVVQYGNQARITSYKIK